MKTKLTRSLLACITSLFTVVVFAQVAPSYRFENPTLIAGTDKQVGAIYRFPNVKGGFDALVEVKTIGSGTQLSKIDRTNDGYAEAFQPEIKISGLTNGYVDFKITFVNTNTSVPAMQNHVDVSALDIDGDGHAPSLLYEYNRIDMGGGFYDFRVTSSQLVVSHTGTAYTATNITGILFGASVDTAAHDNMYTVMSNNISSFNFRAGANNGMSGSSTRYSSLYFMRFTYGNSIPLALPKIQKFEGNSKGQQINLNWEMEQSDDLEDCFLEKSETGYDFVSIGNFATEKQNAFKNQYTDNVANAGNYYYRLKLVSNTGEIKYSSILAFKVGTATAAKSLNVYPSAITSQFTAKINSTVNEAGTLQLADMSGRIVYQKKISLQPGMNNISVNDLNTAAKGNFVLVVRTGRSVLSQKVAVL